MHNSILNTLLNIFENTEQLDVLYKRAFGDILIDYTFTEMHCIDCIGKLENPNVTKIAQNLNLTKAAISKIIKKLLAKNAIQGYKNPDNNKEIYYKLTSTGQEVFNKHLSMHEIWCNKDKNFFSQFDKKDIETTLNILTKYNECLQTRLENIMEDLK